MNYVTLLQSKTVHGLVLTGFILMSIFEPVRAIVPAVDGVVALGILIAWLLGTRYEREFLIRAGAIDRDDAITAERSVV